MSITVQEMYSYLFLYLLTAVRGGPLRRTRLHPLQGGDQSLDHADHAPWVLGDPKFWPRAGRMP